eukprot:TRINITY_DN3744_c0_g1_i1.p1 TRINITY_DN3744_c0_g1~~TRINITY_DN3744_c0_g1_i1.p1  ORF type:complete len:249 (-),score=69.27 TRINITY_DN3744_c0_g1_i1:35-781(-)
MSYDLKGKVALITGASSGIGAATAKLFASSGAIVVLAARRVDKLNETAQLITTEVEGTTVGVVALDVTDTDNWAQVVAEVIEEHGQLDFLVNNAGVMLLSYIRNLEVAEWNTMIDVNIKGVLNGVAAVISHMRERKTGHIVNVSSDADRKIFPGSSVYSPTKAFVSLFSEGLRTELCQENIPVGVTSISCGATESELGTHITATDLPPYEPMEILKASDVADVIAYSVSRPNRVNMNNILFRPIEQDS